MCNYSAHELKNSDRLRVATASDAADILGQMDSVMQQREQGAAAPKLSAEPTADQIVSHMAGYVEMG